MSKNKVFCTDCEKKTVNPIKGRCLECHRKFRKFAYNPPVAASRFDPSEFASNRAQAQSLKSIKAAKACFINQALLQSNFRDFGNVIKTIKQQAH